MDKIYTYHKTIKVINNDDTTETLTTQLYNIGVYCIVNNDPRLQFTSSPPKLVKQEKELKKKVESKQIKSFELISPITVTKDDTGWIEVTK